MDMITYAICKKIATAAVSGINDMRVENQTLYIETKDGKTLEIIFPTPQDGISIVDVEINEEKHIICQMSDGSTIDGGEVPYYIPQKGVDYYTNEDKEELKQEIIESIDESFVLDIRI